MVLKKMFFISLCLGLGNTLYADWLDDLTELIAPSQEWKTEEAVTLVEEYNKQDTENVNKIEEKIKQLGSGFWATIHYWEYKTELANARSQKKFHEKLIKIFKELPENKKDREKLVQNLVILYGYKKDLEVLRKELEAIKSEWSTAQGVTEKAKIAARVAAKETQIAAKYTQVSTKRSLIKGSLLLS